MNKQEQIFGVVLFGISMFLLFSDMASPEAQGISISMAIFMLVLGIGLLVHGLVSSN